MKRTSYVDKEGNPIDQTFESKKTVLYIFFIVGTIIPLIIIGFIIYTMIDNNNCNNIYKEITSATKEYLTEEDKWPNVEGENVTVSLSKLYSSHYLNAYKTKSMTCGGTVKITKYKSKYIYTLNLTSCNTCTTNTRYTKWSNELSYYPKGKPMIDVIPYYNYYERQVVTTDYSKYYEKDELSTKKSQYGIYLPADEEELGTLKVPEEGNIVEIQKKETPYYRHKDKQWKWYDIKGNYSEFSSTQPNGYAKKDENTLKYTNWSEYSLTYPEEKEYREIIKATGYQFYYEKDGKKIYAANKNYVTNEDVDTTKYNMRENKSVTMYHYRDKQWRWYNGQKRKYSMYSSTQPKSYNYRDDELIQTTNYTGWEEASYVNNSNKEYRIEEKKIMTKFRYVYEILSDPVLKKPVQKQDFTSIVGMTVPEFVTLEDYKIEVSYKFKYRKR